MYSAKFGYRHTAADAADSAVFAMRNPSTSSRVLIIEKVLWVISFDGTAGASRVGYGITRYTVADPTGGTSPARINTSSAANSTSVIADANIKNGAVLTLTSAVFEGNFHEALIATLFRQAEQRVDCSGLVLAPGEGLAIRTAIVAIAGQACSGSVWWGEHAI